MRFFVYRTCGKPGQKPCAGAYKSNIKIDESNKYHDIDQEDLEYCVDIADLQNLLEFIGKYGPIIIDRHPRYYVNTIEIYNWWRDQNGTDTGEP